MTKKKANGIYNLIDTKEEAIEQFGLSYINDEAVARFIIDNNQESALETMNNPTGESALHYVVVGYIRSRYPHITMKVLQSTWLHTMQE